MNKVEKRAKQRAAAEKYWHVAIPRRLPVEQQVADLAEWLGPDDHGRRRDYLIIAQAVRELHERMKQQAGAQEAGNGTTPE